MNLLYVLLLRGGSEDEEDKDNGGGGGGDDTLHEDYCGKLKGALDRRLALNTATNHEVGREAVGV